MFFGQQFAAGFLAMILLHKKVPLLSNDARCPSEIFKRDVEIASY
jgi:hypothetical protein